MPVAKLAEWGYAVEYELTEKTIAEVKRFLHEWCDRVKAIYCAVSLPPEFPGRLRFLEKGRAPGL